MIYDTTNKNNIDEMGMVIDTKLIKVQKTKPKGKDIVIVSTWDDDEYERTQKANVIAKKEANEAELVKKLGGDSQINALAKFVNVFAEEFAKQNPESKTAGMLQIVNETLNKE